MDILNSLLSEEEWRAFLAYKISGGHLSASDTEKLTQFVTQKDYLTAAKRIVNGGFFSLPEAVQVNKTNSDKKRTVFVFPEAEAYIQKFLAYKLLDYDYLFCDNLYSFRRDMGVKKAIASLVFDKDIRYRYSYKLDISDYFNSVNADILLPQLRVALADNLPLYRLIEHMLREPEAIIDGERRRVKKGILAGSPLSGFLANLYVSELDARFYDRGVPYARYSDDIIFFCDTREELEDCVGTVLRFLKEKELTVNENKVFTSAPAEAWSFLGFSYHNGVIDISAVSKMKLKKKMRRKARALYRWKIMKGADDERAVRAFIRYFNQKLYENPVNNEITWCRWYFPIINTADSLKELDAYMQQCVRYIATGKQSKAKYRFSYDKMKALGYVTLVNNYYKYREKKFEKSVDKQGSI